MSSCNYDRKSVAGLSSDTLRYSIKSSKQEEDIYYSKVRYAILLYLSETQADHLGEDCSFVLD